MSTPPIEPAADDGVGQRPTIREIADLAGVSIATVSRVLNRRPDVAEATRQAVLEVVRREAFTPRRSARALARGRTSMVGVTIPVVHAWYFAHILSGAAEALHELDLRVVLCPTQHRHDREAILLDQLMHGTVDGAILLLPEESRAELEALQDKHHPFVVIDPREPVAESVTSVSAAHAAGARTATQHLLDLGHRRIAVITGPRGWMATEERLNGYRSALAAAGVLPACEYEVASDFLMPGGEQAAAQLLALPDPPTAVFAFNDNLAIGALRAARERGVDVPGRLSIVGFDDAENASVVAPALTTVRQPLAELGRTAVSLLVDKLDGDAAPLHVELATRLVVRESTAPPPA